MIVALVVAAVIAVGIIVVGLRFLLAPLPAARAYGVPTPELGGFLAVKGVRDIASGLVPLVLLLAGQWTAVGWFLVAAAFIPLGDTVIVLRNGGTRAAAFGIHTLTAAVMIAAGLVLALS